MWKRATQWEEAWWGNCVNTYGEQEKQILYAQKMGLEFVHDGKSPYNIVIAGENILDIGCGPTSLLLKCVDFNQAVGVDPIRFPAWVLERYKAAHIKFVQKKAEEYFAHGFDEAWIYNVLQHTENPQAVIKNAQLAAKVIRLFEWIDTPTNTGHLHTLTQETLDRWLGGNGKVEQLNGQGNCFGKAYYGIFPTK